MAEDEFEPIRQARRNKALEWLDQKWPRQNRLCPICSTRNWTISDVFEWREYRDGNLYLGVGPIFPVFTVMCENCGFVRTFNAVKSGVLEGEQPNG